MFVNTATVFGTLSKHHYIEKTSPFGALYGWMRSLVQYLFKNDNGGNLTNREWYRDMNTNFLYFHLFRVIEHSRIRRNSDSEKV